MFGWFIFIEEGGVGKKDNGYFLDIVNFKVSRYGKVIELRGFSVV